MIMKAKQKKLTIQNFKHLLVKELLKFQIIAKENILFK